jgi:diaminopimelate epimerase
MKNTTIKFTKMHGLGNDFVIIDSIRQSIQIGQIPIQKLSHRYTGIGFDQLIWISPSSRADFSCRFFNTDTSEAEQCGNGIRCVARFLHENGLTQKKQMTLETKAGIVKVNIHDYDNIEVSLGIPSLQGKKTLALDTYHKDSNLYDVAVLSMGNPHAILSVDSIKNFPVRHIGQLIATHPTFPQGTNVGFMQVIDQDKVLLRTYERGVGETLACGSNACAAVVAGIVNHALNKRVTVELELGQLQIQWQGENQPVIMTGPAVRVFDGEY